MKKLICLLLLGLILCGCTPKLPNVTEDGTPWDDDWTAIGTEMGVALPEQEPALYEYNDVQGLDGIYYASFTWGQSEKITNDAGQEADLFPAQLYLLTQECMEKAEAEAAIAQWLAVGQTGYRLTELEPWGEYTLYAMEPKNESPFAGGILALGIHNCIAVSAELMWAEPIFENPAEETAAFLSQLRFRGQEG